MCKKPTKDDINLYVGIVNAVCTIALGIYMAQLGYKSSKESSTQAEQLHMDTLLLKNDSDLVRQDSTLLALNKKTDSSIGRLDSLNSKSQHQIKDLIGAVQQLRAIHTIAQNEFKAQDASLHIIERQEAVSDEVDSNYLQTLLANLKTRMIEVDRPILSLIPDSPTMSLRQKNSILTDYLVEMQNLTTGIELNKQLYKLQYTKANILALEKFIIAVRHDLVSDESTGLRAFEVVPRTFQIWSYEDNSSITTAHISGFKAAEREISTPPPPKKRRG